MTFCSLLRQASKLKLDLCNWMRAISWIYSEGDIMVHLKHYQDLNNHLVYEKFKGKTFRGRD